MFTAGQDYTAAATGTVTIPTTTAQAFVQVPIVNDGVAEPTETLRVRLTSSSVPADISDTGLGTDRPATQQWRLVLYCIGFGLQDEAYGNIVTGNGTSTAQCGTPYVIIAFQPIS